MTQRAHSTPIQASQAQPAPWRLLAILAALLLGLGGILVRLGDVQVVKRSALASQADRTVVRTLTVLPRRGTITDRYGLPLAVDIDRQSLYVVPELIDAGRRPQVVALEEPALRLMYEPQRAYPQGALAAYVLGGVNHDGDGIGGVEASYNGLLHGATGIITAEVDALN